MMERLAHQDGLHTVRDFAFESGERMAELTIGYAVYGTLNAARDNLLLVLPGTGNIRTSSLEHIGPGRAYDTDRYCVVSTDAIGGGISSRPSEGLRGNFPRYGIRDMVRAQVDLVRHGLGLGDTPIAVLAGASMGAFQALEWLIHYPASVKQALLLVPAIHGGPLFRLTTAQMFALIQLDADWRGGDYTAQPLAGLRAAGRHYLPWTVSDLYLAQQDPALLEQEVEASGNWFAQWDAWDIIRRYEASTRHDIAIPYGGDTSAALARVQAEVLVLPCRQDRLLGVEGGRQIAAGIARATCAEIDSSKGHLAWRAVPGSPQTTFATAQVRRFLGLDTDAR
jgi:homoserine O-acetyltransferase